MKYLKQLMLLTVFFFLSSTAAVADPGVILLLKNGKSISFTFKQEPKIITGEKLIIQSKGVTQIEYPYSDINKIYTGEISAQSKINTSSQSLIFHMDKSTISIKGLKKGERVRLYSVSGELIKVSPAASEEGFASLHLPQGKCSSYILRSDSGYTYKFSQL